MNPYSYINNLDKYGAEGGFKPGLERVKALLKPFGNPEQELPIIHVAGSNGKGSTIAFLKAIYREAGYRVGKYISPHLLDFNERIEINDRYIKTSELEELVDMLAPVVEEVGQDKELGKPSYFEVVTALAFLYFSRVGVDLLLLEVGLGGRLDATNVVQSPLVTLITSISLEHTSYLGNTVADIAREKAGIVKEGKPVITGVRDREALQVIKAVARERGSEVVISWDDYKYKTLTCSFHEQRFKLYGKRRGEYKIGLLGEHQIQNALLALATVEKLADLYPVGESDIKEGLKKAFIPGRLEVYKENPYIILDGAHNQEGIEILTDFLKKHISPDQRIYLVFGVLADKDLAAMLSPLGSIDNLELILTKNSSERALSPEIISKEANLRGINNKVFTELKKAINSTLEKAEKNDVICITGSFYTVAEAKIILERLV